MVKVTLQEIRGLIKTPTIGNILSSGLRFGARSVWALLIPIYLTVDNYSEFSVVITYAQVLLFLSLLGSTSAIMREKVSNVELALIFTHSLILLCMASFAGYFATDVFAGEGRFLLVLLYVTMLVAYNLLVAHVKSKLLFLQSFVIEFVGLALFAGIVFVLVRSNAFSPDYRTVLWGEVAWSVLLVVLLMGLLVTQKGESGFAFASLWNKLKSVYSIGLLVLVDVIIWRRVEVFFLASSPDSVAGPAIVNISLQYGMVITMIPGSILEAWYPQISDYFRQRGSAEFTAMLHSKLRSYTRFYAIVSLAGLLAFFVYFELFLPKYHQWTTEILFFIFVRLFFGFAAFFSSVVYAVRKERALFLWILGTAVGSIILHSLLTIPFGLKGCMIAFFLTQLLVFVVTLRTFNSLIPLSVLRAGRERT